MDEHPASDRLVSPRGVDCPGDGGDAQSLPVTAPCEGCGHPWADHREIVYTECANCGCRYYRRGGEVSLFNWGEFKLHSGGVTPFKIDCDALRPEDWKALANYALLRLPKFSRVEGVPMGGLTLATFLSPHAVPDGRLLIVDDVFTTGASMEEQRAGRAALGLVVFARQRPPLWIDALFYTEAAR